MNIIMAFMILREIRHMHHYYWLLGSSKDTPFFSECTDSEVLGGCVALSCSEEEGAGEERESGDYGEYMVSLTSCLVYTVIKCF